MSSNICGTVLPFIFICVQTAISLVSGAYLAELQDNGLQLEQAVLVNFTDHDPHQLDINPAPG